MPISTFISYAKGVIIYAVNCDTNCRDNMLNYPQKIETSNDIELKVLICCYLWEVRRLGIRERVKTITVSGFEFFHNNCHFLWGKMFQRQI